jgi:hypothetical protein
VSLAAPTQKHAVSDIYTTDHNRLPSVDCDAFGLTADVSGIKAWVIPLQVGMISLSVAAGVTCIFRAGLMIWMVVVAVDRGSGGNNNNENS